MKYTRAKIEQRLNHEFRSVRARIFEAQEQGRLPWQNLHPASFQQWLARTNGRYEAWYPVEWRSSDLPFESSSKVAAAIHVYYPDLIDTLVEGLKNVPVDLDVYVTNASGGSVDPDAFKVGNVQNVAVLEVKNHGRDIAPLIHLVNAGYLDQYELILKIHTKKSPWRENHEELSGTGDGWREETLGDLVGNTSTVERILTAIANDARIGAVGPRNSVLGPQFWGGDREIVEELGKRIGVKFEKDSLNFISGSMYWIRGFILQGLRALCIHGLDFDNEAGQVDGTTAHALERLIGLLTVEAGLKSVESCDIPEVGDEESVDIMQDGWKRFAAAAHRTPSARFVPFYLPQFHPSAVNDRWWGKGFTEWANVTRGRPAFPGHAQPLLPGELGFYDLRMDSVRERQLEMERYAGIEGFMYYYYWFSGERVLNLPIESLRKQQELDQPYCIMWANENWTRAWDGQTTDVLLEQRYDQVPAEDFIDDVMEFLLDPRYMRIDGKAVIAIYRPAQMSSFREVVGVWRQRAREAGVGELLLLSVDVTKQFDGLDGDLELHDIDGHLGFPPHGVVWPKAKRSEANPHHRFTGHLVSYSRMADAATVQAQHIDSAGYPGVMVNFDNTARKQWKADIWYGSNPYTFHRWLLDVVEAIASRPFDQRVIFINAWNEWAESAVLEPTERFGWTYLQAVRNVAFS